VQFADGVRVDILWPAVRNVYRRSELLYADSRGQRMPGLGHWFDG
jgi:hypothetical protein